MAQEQESEKLVVPVALMVATVAAGITQAADQEAVLLVLAVGLVQAQEREPVRAQGPGLGQELTEAKATAVVKAAAAVRLMAVAKVAAVAAGAEMVEAREAAAKPV